MNIIEYAQRLGVKPTVTPRKAVDIEAGKAGYNKYLADEERKKKSQQKTKDEEKWWEKIGRWMGNSPDTTLPLNQGFNQATTNYANDASNKAQSRPQDNWTDDDRWAFGEIYAKNAGDAYIFAEKLNEEYARIKKIEQTEWLKKWTERNAVNSVLGSVASLGINAVAGGVGYMDALAQLAGRGYVTEHDYLYPHEVANVMQSTVAENLSEKSKALGYAYNIGMSVGQSFLAGATGGSTGALVQFFGMSASNGYTNAKARGADDNQALAFGTLSGLAEAIPEMISVDKFLGLASSAKVENVFKSILKQAGAEALEEGTTSVLTEVADRWVMGGKSQYALTVQELMASGMSEADAKNKAFTQTLLGIAGDAVTGAISGTVSGSVGVGINRFNQRYLQKEANTKAKEALTPEASNLISEGKKYDATSNQAARLEQKMAEGKELTGYELRRLANDVSQATQNANVDAVRQAIVEKMKAEGVSASDAKRLGEIALNKALGNDVSKIQDVMLKRNEAALKVYNQIDAKNIATGESDSEWIEKTPLRQLRYEAEAKNGETAETQPTDVKGGVERLKEKAMARKLTDAAKYKINDASLEDKFNVSEGDKIKFVKSSESSKIHTDEISSSLTKEDIAELTAIEKLANELGVDIHVYESKKNKDGNRTFTRKDGTVTSDSGWYDPNDRSIHIDLRAGNNGEGTMLYTAAHELVHFMKDVSPEHFDALEKLVTAELIKGGKSIEALLQIQRDSLIANGKKQTDADFEEVAREEMVADACMKFLASKSAIAEIKALRTKNKGLWNALKKFFTSFFNKINKIYKTVDPDSSVGKYIGDMHSKAKAIRDAFMEGVAESANKVQSKAKAQDTSKNDIHNESANQKSAKKEIRSKVRAEFKAELNDWYSNTSQEERAKSGKRFNLGKTTDVLKSIGVKDTEIYFGASKINTILEKNESITIETISEAVTLLDNPILIMESKTVSDSIVLFGEVYTSGDKPVMISLLINPKNKNGEILDYIVITSAYGRRTGNLQNLINHSRIYYVNEDKKRTDTWLKALGLQLPSALTTYGSIDSIAENPPKVNTPSENSSKEIRSKARDSSYLEAVNRGDMETAQRMVNDAAKEAGYTVRGLHATNATFNEFDISKTSEYNYHGKGIYFTNSQKDLENNYENYEGPDPWQKIEAEAYEMLYDKYGISYEDTLTSDSEIIDKLNECYDEVINKFKRTLRRITAYLKFDNPLIIGKGELASDYDLSKYDGIIDNHVYENIGHSGMDENTVHYIVLNPNNIKSADPVTYDDNGNVIPLSERFNEKSKDIRHKSRGGGARSTVTSGQYAQTKANLSHSKVYSKVSAMSLVSKIAPGIRNRSYEALSDELWKGLNTYTTIDDKREFASDMSEMFIDRMLVDTLVPNKAWDEASEKIAYLKTAITSINFTEAERTEIRHIVDTDGLRRILGRWGYKTSKTRNKRPYDLDVFITDISREMPGMEHLNEMHPVDALMEIDSLYEELSATIKEKYESAYKDFSDAEIDEIKHSIEDDIMKAYDELGEQSAISKYLQGKIEYYQDRIDYWKAENAKTRSISRWNGILSTKAQHIRDLKKGAFYNATQHHQDVFKESIEELAKIQWRGNISPKRIREVFAKLKPWYTKDNPMLYDAKSEDNLYSETIATYIEKIGDIEKGKFDTDTYAMVYDVMNHLYTMMRNYNKVFRAGRWEDATALVDSYLKIMEETKRQRGALGRLRDGYVNEFMEPMAVARRADGYDANGFFTQTMEDLRRASINASVGEMNLRKEYDGFIDANKKYLSEAAKTTVTYRGVEVPKLNLIGLYMTMKRKHARAGLALNGFTFTKKNKWWDSEDFVKVPGYLSAENVTQEMIDTATEEQIKVIEQSFTETDKEYIRILEKLFNEDLKALKIERDMERQGYTNATLDYYYPIMRGAIAENVDTAKLSDQNRATNASFNKNTVTGAKQRLVIISADAMVNRHITDMCKYYYMSQAIENYNVLYNCDISGNANNPVNISGFVKENKIWDKDYQYFKKLVADMQGIRDPQTTFEKAIEGMRGGYAKFALGANLKVLFTQFSSMIAAGDVISYGSILSAKKFNISSADVDKYCPLAAVRNYDKSILRAMTLTDKFGKVSEALTFGISKVDRYVVKRLFAACQIEAQKNGLGELGTEENKIAAGKLLEKVIIETQQNSFATERSSAMRSKNEFLKSITMFTADGMKIVSRMYDAFGELRAAKKSGDKARIKSARKNFAKSIATAVNIAIYMTAIATLFNWLYDRDDEEDENKLLTLTMDTVGNFIGALPLISDLYDYMVDGFEVEGVAFDTINNLFSGINNIRKDVVSVISGDGERSKQDINRDLRTMLYGVGQVTGLPFRNIYNLSRGIIGKFSSVGGYKLDSKFYKTSLATDLDKAIESGDNAKTSYILSLIYKDRIDETVSQKQIDEIIKLTNEGYSVLPRDIPDTITRNGKKYTLTATQKDTYMETYSQVVDAIDKLISSSFYSRMSTKEKADLISYYHDQYREMAVNKALNFEDKKKTIYAIVGFDKFVEYAYSIKDIESDKDKEGNSISGSKKKKVIEKINQLSVSEEKKLLLIAYSGYTIDSEKERQKLLKYLNKLKLSTSDKKNLAEMCGFEYKNGKIVENKK